MPDAAITIKPDIMRKNTLGRRDFLKKTTAATIAFTIVPRHVLGGTGFTAPSDQLTKGII